MYFSIILETIKVQCQIIFVIFTFEQLRLKHPNSTQIQLCDAPQRYHPGPYRIHHSSLHPQIRIKQIVISNLDFNSYLAFPIQFNRQCRQMSVAKAKMSRPTTLKACYSPSTASAIVQGHPSCTSECVSNAVLHGHILTK